MFETFESAPPDAILGLTEVFRNDPNPEKINLSVGVYKDENGTTPILRVVKEAEKRLVEEESTKSYLGIAGSPEYAARVEQLIFGEGHEVVASKRAETAQTPGGTGALRVAADFIDKKMPGKRVWLSKPTWPNHPNIFRAAGLELETYPYFDEKTNGLDFENMLTSLGKMPKGDVVVLHGCCHNPSGIDPSLEQWKRIGEVIEQRGLFPLIDFAYQGLGDGLREDAAGLQQLCRPGAELMIASSFSKNFGLYRERTGALTLVGATGATAQLALGHIKNCIRANYSNPPSHGAAIVTTVLADPQLRADWQSEVDSMRERIHAMRQLFAQTLHSKGALRDFSFITSQRGMFSFSGLTAEQVDRLREEYSIYIVRSGRINVAGMTTGNMDRLSQAIAEVL